MPHEHDDPRRGHPTGFYITNEAREEERRDEEYRRQYQRDQERKEAASRGRPQAVRAFYGRDYLGRPYVSELVGWVRRVSPGVIEVDLGLAASQGVEIARDPSGYVRLRA